MFVSPKQIACICEYQPWDFLKKIIPNQPGQLCNQSLADDQALILNLPLSLHPVMHPYVD